MSEARTAFIKRLGSWLLLALLVALLMRGWWGSGLPVTPRQEHLARLCYVWLCRRLVESGHPLAQWNPIDEAGLPTFGGHPHHVHLLVALLSVLLHTSPECVIKLVVYASFLAGAIGVYEFTFYLTKKWGPALVAATAFAFAPAQVNLRIEEYVFNLFWAGVPWTFLTYERARDRLAEGKGVSMAPGIALGYLTLVYTYLMLALLPFLGGYVLVREVQRFRAGERDLRRPLALLLATGAVWVGLSSFYTLPVLLEAKYLAVRSDMAMLPAKAVAYLSPLLLLKTLFMRWMPSFPLHEWDSFKAFTNITWYLGLMTTALALLSLKGWRSQRATLSLWTVFLMGLLLAIDGSFRGNPVYGVLKRTPLLARTVVFAYRAMLPATFASSVLAGMGFEHLSRRWPGPKRETLLAGLVLVALLADFAPLSVSFRTLDDYLLPDEIAAYRWLEEQGDAYRYWTPVHLLDFGDLFSYLYNLRYISKRRLHSERPVKNVWAPARSVRLFEQELALVGVGRGISRLGKVVLSLANTRHIVIHTREPVYVEAVTSLSAKEGWPVVWRTEHVAVLENLEARPYAQLYGAAVSPKDGSDKEMLSLLEELAPRGVALLEKGVDVGLPREAPAGELGVAHWSRPRPEHIEVQVWAEAPVILMVSEAWHPNWHVLVDGKERELLRVNYAFMGVKLEAGEHRVSFVYRLPWYYGAGYAISALTLLALMARGTGVLVGRGLIPIVTKEALQ